MRIKPVRSHTHTHWFGFVHVL